MVGARCGSRIGVTEFSDISVGKVAPLVRLGDDHDNYGITREMLGVVDKTIQAASVSVMAKGRT